MIDEKLLIKELKKMQGRDLMSMFIDDVIKVIKRQPKVKAEDIDEMYLELVKENDELKKWLAAGRWILRRDRMPAEHDSIFAKVKGTDKWNTAMFERISDDVLATVEYEDGTRHVKVLHTVDGEWLVRNFGIKFKVIAWKPLPEPYDLNLRRE